MKTKILFIILILSALTAFSCRNNDQKISAHDDQKHEHKDSDLHTLAYECPMNCEKGKVYKAKGKCPVCQMKLIKVNEENHQGHKHDPKNHQGHEH
ncbi:heavy metal-binding domain-containing protein [Flavobacterium aquidurense]|uniref:heavy metal-binding domain-containing protein n=1 Tax=Flavobacterium aquidurense TaxID=362413 RepID=UPI0009214408|nr:heavy metal-binding domain-containing protein [Flavobacterium aquidurense]SHH85998.1 hypothetical protein SAMN05444481_13516 [Flavobacterium frigidimaris]